MRYQAILSLNGIDFTNYSFEAFASTEQAVINKLRKQATKAGLNELNSHGQISIYKRRYCDYDENYYYVNTVSAWH